MAFDTHPPTSPRVPPRSLPTPARTRKGGVDRLRGKAEAARPHDEE